jgi:hypothetical protein
VLLLLPLPWLRGLLPLWPRGLLLLWLEDSFAPGTSRVAVLPFDLLLPPPPLLPGSLGEPLLPPELPGSFAGTNSPERRLPMPLPLPPDLLPTPLPEDPRLSGGL